MLQALVQLAEKVIARPLPLGDLRRRGESCDSPAEAVGVAKAFGALVTEHRKGEFDRTTSVDYDLVVDLFDFFADLPSWIEEEALRLGTFPPAPARAWQPVDTFSSLMELVHDVWEHAFGPELEDDPRIIEVLLRQRFERVCDYGSGAGYYAFRLAREGVNVTCVEINEVKKAFLAFRRCRRAEGERISLEAGEGLFDGVLAINVFDHLEDASEIIERLAGLLRPGGKLCYFAQFIDDGWHQSDPRVKEATFRELARHFTFPQEPADTHSYFEVLEKRDGPVALMPQPVSPRDRRFLKPVAHYAVHLFPLDGESYALQSPRFYITPLSVTPELRHLLTLCRGELTIADICGRMEKLDVDESEVWSCLQLLWENHVVGMDTSLLRLPASPA